jgi:hypothetical protein
MLDNVDRERRATVNAASRADDRRLLRRLGWKRSTLWIDDCGRQTPTQPSMRAGTRHQGIARYVEQRAKPGHATNEHNNRYQQALQIAADTHGGSLYAHVEDQIRRLTSVALMGCLLSEGFFVTGSGIIGRVCDDIHRELRDVWAEDDTRGFQRARYRMTASTRR